MIARRLEPSESIAFSSGGPRSITVVKELVDEEEVEEEEDEVVDDAVDEVDVSVGVGSSPLGPLSARGTSGGVGGKTSMGLSSEFSFVCFHPTPPGPMTIEIVIPSEVDVTVVVPVSLANSK